MKDRIEIDGTVYVKERSTPEVDGMRYCIVRTHSAGVFAGYLKSLNGKHGVVLNARRIWKWSGAASLSQLAIDGTVDPSGCKFPEAVAEVILTEVIEVVPCTEQAMKSICEVPIWKR